MKTHFRILLFLLISAITFFVSPSDVFASDPKLNELRASLRVSNRSDGLHDVYVQMSQQNGNSYLSAYIQLGQPEPYTRYKFYLEVGDNGDEKEIDYWDVYSPQNNPPEKHYVMDFRSESGDVLNLRVKSTGNVTMVCNFSADCRDLAAVPITFTVGGGGYKYINLVEPTTSGNFRIDLEGSDTGCAIASCKYFLRLKGQGDQNTWGGAYSCTMAVGGDSLIPLRDFSCDFSAFAPNTELVLALYRGTNAGLGRLVSEYKFNTSLQLAKIREGPTAIANAIPNDFNTIVEVFPAGENGTYALRVVRTGTLNVVSTSDCSRALAPAAVQGFVCDYSYLDPRVSYEQVLISPTGIVLDRKSISISEAPSSTGAGGSCACGDVNGPVAQLCKVIPDRSSCWFGFEAKVQSCDEFSCSCSCGFIPGSSGMFGLPALTFTPVDFSEWMARGQQYIIALGIFASIFIVPYFGVLLASGNPENIEKGLEWAKSWAFGLLLLLLSSFVIRVIGSDILGF